MSKQFRYIVAALALLGFAVAEAQTRTLPAFEADVEFSYTLPDDQELTQSGRIYQSSTGKVRQDMGIGSTIVDFHAGTVTMLIPETKQAHVLAIPPDLQRPPQLGIGNPIPEAVEPFEETTIDGRRIAKTLIVDPQGRTQEVWTAIDLGIIVYARAEADGVATSQTLRNLSEGEPDPGVFEVPSDYTVFEIPAQQLDLLTPPDTDRARGMSRHPLSQAMIIPLEPVPMPTP